MSTAIRRKKNTEKTKKRRLGGWQNSRSDSHRQPQPQAATAAGSPEADPELNYILSICWQLHQKNQQLGKAYQDLKVQFDELQVACQEKEEQLAQDQQDADERAELVCKLSNVSSPTKKS